MDGRVQQWERQQWNEFSFRFQVCDKREGRSENFWQFFRVSGTCSQSPWESPRKEKKSTFKTVLIKLGMLEATHNNTRNLIKCIPNFPRKSRKRIKFIISFNSFAFYGSDDGWRVDGEWERGMKVKWEKMFIYDENAFHQFFIFFLVRLSTTIFCPPLTLDCLSAVARARVYVCMVM